MGNIRPRYTRAPATAEFGAMSPTVLDLLRQAGAPLTTGELADRIIAERGLNAGDRGIRRNMVKRVGMALRYQRTNGMVAEAPVEGTEVAWDIARQVLSCKGQPTFHPKGRPGA